MLEWQPSATLNNLQLRAKILQKTRQFFEELGVLEVDTPLICASTATDPYIMSFETELLLHGQREKRFLQTSPEFPMKRLLAAGSGSIFQVCKAFRNGEASVKHNPEFTILEWYRINFTHIELMEEVEDFLTYILDTPHANRISYHDLFQGYFGINPHTASVKELQEIAEHNQLSFAGDAEDRDTWLDLLMTHIIEPELGQNAPVFIFDYPDSQAALARIRKQDNYHVGERFEVYYKGLELANGYHELGDPEEQLQRFKKDNEVRKKLGYSFIPIDDYLLAALANFPDCAGVALGFDRLVCLAANIKNITDVLTFPTSCA